MQIDWLTVMAQIVNFLVLVWLLKHFLYQPVVNAMARREDRITARLREAEAREREAQAESRRYRENTEAFERARAQKLNEAREAADEEKRHLLNAARHEIDVRRDTWRADLQREQEDFSRALKREFAEMVVTISRRVLAGLADVTLERQIVAAFLHRLDALSTQERAPFTRSSETLRLLSTFDLDTETRKRLREALRTTAEIEYVRDPELVCGIALVAAGHKLEWNVMDYLNGLDEQVDALLVTPARERT